MFKKVNVFNMSIFFQSYIKALYSLIYVYILKKNLYLCICYPIPKTK